MDRQDEGIELPEPGSLESLFQRFYPPMLPSGVGTVVPVQSADGGSWWLSLDEVESEPREWTVHKEYGLPLPAVCLVHQLLDEAAGVYATYELGIFSNATKQCYSVTVWSHVNSDSDITQDHLRAASVARAAEVAIPALVDFARWELGRREVDRYAQKIATARPGRRSIEDDVARVAAIYNAAGASPRKAVEKQLGLSPSQARRRIDEARKQGKITRSAPRGGRPRKEQR